MSRAVYHGISRKNRTGRGKRETRVDPIQQPLHAVAEAAPLFGRLGDMSARLCESGHCEVGTDAVRQDKVHRIVSVEARDGSRTRTSCTSSAPPSCFRIPPRPLTSLEHLRAPAPSSVSATCRHMPQRFSSLARALPASECHRVCARSSSSRHSCGRSSTVCQHQRRFVDARPCR